jgi:arylsulfatase
MNSPTLDTTYVTSLEEVLWGLERFRWEGPEALAPGKHTITFDFKYNGPGFGKGGTGVLTVDGKEAANQRVAHTTPFTFMVDETFDVGMDTRTPVDDKDYQVPFRFTGKLDKLTIKLEPQQLSQAERQEAAEMVAKAHDER